MNNFELLNPFIGLIYKDKPAPSACQLQWYSKTKYLSCDIQQIQVLMQITISVIEKLGNSVINYLLVPSIFYFFQIRMSLVESFCFILSKLTS